jgi:Fe-S-cluster-containing dehydrogenase component
LFSRRQVLKLGGISIVAASALAPVLARSAAMPLIIMEKAHGIVIADPAVCVGCGRCELACTEFNDGKAAPTLSRIKVDRNANFGPGAPLLAWREGRGLWGNGLIVQDLCKQCPHPVPCADICPEGAIVAAPLTGTRMVNVTRCTGCKICLKACPWEMISFDPDTRKATKCHLCNGKPKCVEACPAASLSYVPWRDLTGKIPPRVSLTARPQGDRAASCFECHLPGQRKNASWVDLLGIIFLPVVVLAVLAHGAVRAIVKR